jgi:ATP-dependent protease ClpP protease subunit|tara:strand:+ start:7502 stop:8161 length:660 start_codon:yes stop_codon:yes gene_type:complete
MNRTNRSHIYSALSNWHDYGILSQTREIFLESGEDGIGSKQAIEFIKNLTMLESLNSNPIIVHQYNIGGDQNAGFAIYDAIKASKCKFLFVCYGSASSMGSIIPQAVIGKGLRVTHPNTEWLIHEGSCETSGTTKQFISNAEALKRSKELMYDIYVNACKKGVKFKGKKPVEIKAILKRRLNVKEDWILDGRQAVEYGFADVVFGKGQNTSIDNIVKRL